MDISVVIVNYNVKYFLAETLFSVKSAIAKANLKVEVIVVDNQSTDDSISFVRHLYPDYTYIENEDNVGFSIANNQGVKIAKGKYVLILNPDTIIEEETLRKCYDYMETNSDIGALGVKMIDGGGKFLAESKRGFPSPLVAFSHMFGLSKFFPKIKALNKYHLGYLDKNENQVIDVLAGAFMMIPRTVYLEMEGFDEVFFMYGEDIDLSFRIQNAGYKVSYFSEVSIIHFKGESTKRGSLNYVKTFYEAMQIFAKKHFKGSLAWLYIFVINIAIYFQAFLTVGKGIVVDHFFVIQDVVIYYFSFILVSNFWAEYYYHIPDYYNVSIYYYNFPIYVLVIMIAQYLLGVFYKSYDILKLFKAAFIGVVFIAAIYGFFEEAYRSSRMVILLGGLLGTLAVVFSRYVVHYFKQGNINLNSRRPRNRVVIGDVNSYYKIEKIYNNLNEKASLVGLISVSSSCDTRSCIGDVSHFEDVLELYDIDEIVFDRNAVESHFIIDKMKALESKYNFLLLSVDGEVIIGSKSSTNSGEWVTINDTYAISDLDLKRQKRMFDFLTALVLILCALPLLLYQKDKGRFLFSIFSVLIGRFSMVGYIKDGVFNESLPKLKPSMVSCGKVEHVSWLTKKDLGNLNTLYAKNYIVDKDMSLVMSTFPRFT